MVATTGKSSDGVCMTKDSKDWKVQFVVAILLSLSHELVFEV